MIVNFGFVLNITKREQNSTKSREKKKIKWDAKFCKIKAPLNNSPNYLNKLIFLKFSSPWNRITLNKCKPVHLCIEERRGVPRTNLVSVCLVLELVIKYRDTLFQREKNFGNYGNHGRDSSLNTICSRLERSGVDKSAGGSKSGRREDSVCI